jgi:catechol 2,3-dioxygenase-like lactoylglutathione lyase family enzyme
MELVGIVVDDLAATTAFFVELGLKLQGEGPVEGSPRTSRRAPDRAAAPGS